MAEQRVLPAPRLQNVADMKSRKPQPWRCRDCRKHSLIKIGTMMRSSDIKLSKWAMRIYHYSTNLKGVSSMKLHRDLGIGQKTAWFLLHRLREAMAVKDFRFSGPVEADEMYVGGLEKNKHADKKLNAGLGTVGKTAVAGVRDRDTGKVYAEVVERANTPTLTRIAADRTERGATVFTDEWKACNPLDTMGFEHQTVAHGVGQYVDSMAHANGMESFWAMLKLGHHSTYHQMSHEHLNRYMVEFQGRHNQRPLDTLEQMSEMVRGGDGRQTTYTALTASGPHAKRREIVA